LSIKLKKVDDPKLIPILDNLPSAVIIFNQQGKVLHANKLFRYKIIGSSKDIDRLEFITSLSDSNRQAYGDFLEQAGTHDSIRASNNITLKIPAWDGKEMDLRVSLLENTPPDNTILLGIISETIQESDLGKELEKQRNLKNKLQVELEKESELSEMKSRFLSIASHEFRTPLAGILSSVNLITRYLKAEQENWNKIRNKQKIIKHLERVRESVRSLNNILDNFLALGNIEKGNIPINYSCFNLRNMMDKQTSQLQNICKPGQVINYIHLGRQEQVYLDKQLLKNIVNNLVANSIKFSPENSEITVKSEISDDNIYLSFADKGIGIPESEKNKIFRRFYRSRNTLAIAEGTGLGLNIVKKYTELMNGIIDFESKENEGTEFFITLPYQMP
jgi:signal transduction histidine kinase